MASTDETAIPMPSDPIAELAARFGASYLYPIQRFVISNILDGLDQIVVLPTGSGKSLCFQVPSLALQGPTLVVVPLLSLLADQMRRLSAADAPAAVLRGGLSAGEKRDLFDGIRRGRIRLVLATPEACLVPANEASLAGCRFSHFVVDEAHCISEWGESFRPAYLELGALAGRLGIPLVTAFTATASETVISKVKTLLFGERDVRVIAAAPDRPNISYGVEPSLSRLHTLGELLGETGGPTLVFCRTRKGVELAARLLASRLHGREILFYHAGLSREERKAVEGRFLPSRDGVLCATSAYGMGVDKPDIRAVIHADVPPSIEAYLQETGRGGRDGNPTEATLIVSREDSRFLRALSGDAEKRRFEAMLAYALAHGVCRRRQLLSMIGQEVPICSGCDVCGGTASEGPDGEREILAFIAGHPRRFRPEQAAEILKGARGPRVARGFLDRVRGYGLLSAWEKQDIEEALQGLVVEGRLGFPRWGPWRGKLQRGKAPRTPPLSHVT